ncbi:sugar porter family MFS transporter [Mycolicibacterium pulveris]|uniref:sugar porter family MFS transporter n=1 Tax=Mycolicibacterium pulveris TaxID=36813 RepID=UPI003CEEE4D4
MCYPTAGIASMGGLLFGYETGITAGALERGHSSWLSTATLLGALVGAVAAGRIADLVGRRDVIMATGALFTLGAFVSAIAPSELVNLLGGLVVGIGVGAISVAAPLYIAEIAPVARRGTLICIFQLMITIGILLAYVGLAVFPEEHDWRVLLGGGAVLGVILSGLALWLVESPVWLTLMGDHETAQAVRARLGIDNAHQRIREIDFPARDLHVDGLHTVFSLAGRGAIFIGIGLFFVQQFVGINAVLYYSAANLPRLADRTWDFGVASSTGVEVAAVNVAATLVAVILIDRVGRRPLLLTSLVGVALGCAAMAAGAGMHGTGTGHVLSVTGLYLFIVSFAIGLGPIAWVAAAELLPFRVRGIAMGLVVASHWLFDGIAAPTGLILGKEVGLYPLLVLYMCTALGGFVIFRRRFPETKGRSLAAISRHFAVWATQVRETRFAHYAVGVLGSLSGVLAGYNVAITAATLVLLTDDWQLSGLQQGLLASTVVAGGMAGASVAGLLSDRFGRRYLLMSMAVLFVASGFGAALAPSFWWLIVARAAAGFAMGVSTPTAGVYVAEVAPAAIRGRMLSIQLVATSVGVILAYCVGLALVEHHSGWRFMFGFIALPAAIYGLALLPLMESPRWLVAVGQPNAARRSLRRLFGAAADRELAEITTERASPDSDQGGTEHRRARLWVPPHRPVVIVGIVVVFLSVFSGESMVMFYAPTVLEQIGFTDTAVSFAATLGLAVVGLIATVIALAVVDRMGRKPMMVAGLFMAAASLIAMAVLTMAPQSGVVVRWGQVVCLAAFIAAFWLTLGPASGIVTSEIYPQSIRGRATSLASTLHGVFAMIFTLTFPLLLGGLGLAAPLLGYAAISIAGAFYLMRRLPETKGKSLEEIEEFWNRHTTRAIKVDEPV